MPRELGDVLHLFLPVAGPPSEDGSPDAEGRVERPAALPILTLPVSTRDVVRAAFAWNLTVELARLGASATLLVPLDSEAAPLWPEAGRGPVGAEVVHPGARDLGALARAALDVAVARAAEAPDGGVVVVCTPPAWLRDEVVARPLLRWILLFGTPDPRDLRDAYALAKLVFARGADPRVGLAIHGVRRRCQAERAFARVARAAVRHLGRTPVSYGLLADDLHVYRAIVARRPIGLEHPQSPAARALRDVARLLWEDARKFTVV